MKMHIINKIVKHESSNKMSMRSATNLNVKNLPAKSTLKKEKKILYSTTPIRLGKHFQIAEYKRSICWKVLYRITSRVDLYLPPETIEN